MRIFIPFRFLLSFYFNYFISFGIALIQVLCQYQRHIQNPPEYLKMELIAKKVKIFQSLTVFAKISNLDVRQGSEYTSEHYLWLFLVIF